jgi:hypothetical protein
MRSNFLNISRLKIVEDVFGMCGSHPLQILYHKTRTSHNVDTGFISSRQEISAGDCSVVAPVFSLTCRGCFVVKILHEAPSLGEQKQVELFSFWRPLVFQKINPAEKQRTNEGGKSGHHPESLYFWTFAPCFACPSRWTR